MKIQAAAATRTVDARLCPWCGRSDVRVMLPSPDGKRWYRCGSCSTDFFLHVPQLGRTRKSDLKLQTSDL